MTTPAQEAAILDRYTDPANDTPPPQQEIPPRESFTSRRSAKSAAAKAAPTRKVNEPASKPGEFTQPLSDLYSMIALGVSVMDARSGHDDHNCAQTIAENADTIAAAWDDLAQKNAGVRRALRKMVQGGAWAGVIGAHVPIALAIASNHMPGAIPERAEPSEPTQPEPEPVAPAPPQAARKRSTAKRGTSKTARTTNQRRSRV